MGIGGLGAIAVAAWATSGNSEPPASVAAAGSAGSSGRAAGPDSSPEHPSSSSDVPRPTGATGSSPAGSATFPPGTSAVAELFGRDSAANGEPGSIYTRGKASGVIVLLRAEFKNRLALGGEGFTASISTSNGVATATLAFRVIARSSTAADIAQLTKGGLANACGKTLLSAPVWDEGVIVSWEAGARQGRVWTGKGTYGGGERERLAYVLATIVGSNDVIGCGAWNADSPDVEQHVVAALKSVRLGEAPRTDVHGL